MNVAARAILITAAILTFAAAGCHTVEPVGSGDPVTTVKPFLMFEGNAEEAINYYLAAFEGAASVEEINRYGPDEAGPEGTVQTAIFTVHGQSVMCIDSPIRHEFTFTPAFSFFVDCQSEAELDGLFEHLSADGQVLMPLGDYGFSRKFAWVVDRFGVSWQLNLPSIE